MPLWSILFPELEIVKRKFIRLMKFIATFDEPFFGEKSKPDSVEFCRKLSKFLTEKEIRISFHELRH